MIIQRSNIEIDVIFAWLTSVIVGTSTIYLMYEQGDYSIETLLLIAVSFISFMLAWQQVIKSESTSRNLNLCWFLVAFQYALVIMIFLLVPYTYTAILLTLWNSQLPLLMSFKKCLLWSPVWSLAVWGIYGFYWHEDYALLTAILFWTFNVFALIMVNSTNKERIAREATLQLNRELKINQALLFEASKQSERVRIARNIHDLLGHHLTALTINLQVAERLTEGQVKEKISQCYSVAKLLLGDVREAVSEIREKSRIDLRDAFQKLVNELNELDISVNFDQVVDIQDVAIAEVLMRSVQEAVTNCLKHSHATHMRINITRKGHFIDMSIKDNGHVDKPIKEGNGLRGMHERIINYGGSLKFKGDSQGFTLNILLPEHIK